MADGYSLSIQKGLQAALRADSVLTGLVGSRVYDEPPQPPSFPYIRFNTISSQAFDTDFSEGAIMTISLEAHSESTSGRVEATQIVEAIKDALHRKETSVTVTGFDLIELIFRTYNVTRDGVGRGHTGVILLEAMLEKA